MRMIFKLVSLLLRYPAEELKENLPQIRRLAEDLPLPEESRAQCATVLDYLENTGLLELQMNYVRTFDHNRGQTLYLFEHIHGEDRDRGGAMVDLLQEYAKHGLFIGSNELPDYLPLVLEFLAEIDSETADAVLGDAVSVIHHLAQKLKASGSPYAPLLEMIVAVAPCAPVPLTDPPVRDMDEAMEMFGVGNDGVEPLLTFACPQKSEFPVDFVGDKP